MASYIAAYIFLACIFFIPRISSLGKNIPPSLNHKTTSLDRREHLPGVPDLKFCGPANGGGLFAACCPPEPKRDPINFIPDKRPLRVRPIAHMVDQDYIAKYKKAYELMKALPYDDPRSFMNQANAHCAYCNYAFTEEGDLQSRFQIHNSWLFLPWHRWFLYFHEKILGSLIGDPTFALPYWNWDNPEGGNRIPEFFMDATSPLYNEKRNKAFTDGSGVLPVVDLQYVRGATRLPEEKVLGSNLNVMRKTVVDVNDPFTFFGSPYKKGGSVPVKASQGSVERTQHAAVHMFTGGAKGEEGTPFGEDMGNLYSAARDPIFFGHHGNIDRMWNVWRTLPDHNDIEDPDFLETEFLFFDENQDLVRCKIKDCIHAEENLKYKYQDNPNDEKWMQHIPPIANTKLRLRVGLVPGSGTENYPVIGPSSSNSQAISVKAKPITVQVKQPTKQGNKNDEVLVIEDMVVNADKSTSFNVYIDFPDANEGTTANCIEYVGSYNNIPHVMNGEMKFTTNARFSIKHTLDALNLAEDEMITVTIVPRGADKEFTFKGASIYYS